MLYNPNWKAPTKTDPTKLESLIAWLERQPADGVYCYYDCGRCLLSQYFTDMGFRYVHLSDTRLKHADGLEKLPRGFDAIAVGDSGPPHMGCDSWTYGKALKRARAARAARK